MALPPLASPRASLLAAALLITGAAGCAAPPEPAPAVTGPVHGMVTAAAIAHGVPAALMLAIGHVEGGLRLRAHRVVDDDDAVPIAGVLELRHARFNSLRRGAELSGRTERELQEDLALGTDAGARVLDDLARARAIDRGDLGAWAPVVEELSGHLSARDRADYRARVFSLLAHGGVVAARGGEAIVLAPNPDVPLALTFSPPPEAPLGNPEYPGATWFDTSCDGKCNTSRDASVSMIAIHDTEGGWDASVSTLQFDPGKSVHYIIDADGSRVGQFIPESYAGWHVGNHHYNHRMVGIEHVGYSGEDDYQTALYEKSADLVKTIAARYGLSLDRSTIVAHQEVPNGNNIPEGSPPCSKSPGQCVGDANYGGANHHTDPGVNWEWCQYMTLVGGTCKCNDGFDLWNCVHDLSMMVRCPAGTVEIVECADACVVEANGINDHCTPVGSETTSSSSVATTSSAAGGGAPPVDVGAGVGGASAAGGGDGGGLSLGGAARESSSCSTPRPGDSPALPLSWAAGLAAAVLLRVVRRARSAPPR